MRAKSKSRRGEEEREEEEGEGEPSGLVWIGDTGRRDKSHV